jgi:hypothetical protein
MKTIKTIKDLKLKDQTVIPKGTSLSFLRPSTLETVGIFDLNGRELLMRYRSVLKTPSMKSLERWTEDSVCKSVFGAQVEPDGFGPHGEPSWLLAMGLI